MQKSFFLINYKRYSAVQKLIQIAHRREYVGKKFIYTGLSVFDFVLFFSTTKLGNIVVEGALIELFVLK